MSRSPRYSAESSRSNSSPLSLPSSPRNDTPLKRPYDGQEDLKITRLYETPPRKGDNEEPSSKSRKKKHGQAQSGGFLLSSFRENGSWKRPTLGGRHHGAKENSKAKAHEALTPLSTPSRDEVRSGKKKAVVGRSPLSREVTTDVPMLDGATESSGKRSLDTGTTFDIFTDDAKPQEQPDLESSPAHIVNLALNLSESRRRQFSTNRYSPHEPTAARRIVSNPQAGNRQLGSPAGQLKNYLQSSRVPSASNSPSLGRTANRNRITAVELEDVQDGRRGSILPDFVVVNQLEDSEFNPSEATIARAEKARVALELAYYQRYLLQYLAKIPAPQSLPDAKGQAKPNGDAPVAFGRVYNPLQYIRNRKVRVRERMSLNSEADGWKDVDSVDVWISTVRKASEAGLLNKEDEFHLPPFYAKGPSHAEETPLEANAKKLQSGRVARPRIDWLTSPWDMLGDHYWLQGDNKFLIDDHEGNKLFAPKTPTKTTAAKKENLPGQRKRADSETRRPNLIGGLDRADTDKTDATLNQRGRQQHRPREAAAKDHSSSRDRKRKWPKRLIGGQLSSDSDDSDSGLPGQAKKRRAPMTREDQQNLILERQVMSFVDEDDDAEPSWTDASEQLGNEARQASLDIGERDVTNDTRKQSEGQASAAQSPQKPRKQPPQGSPLKSSHWAEDAPLSLPVSPGDTTKMSAAIPNLSPVKESPVIRQRPSKLGSLPQRSLFNESDAEQEVFEDAHQNLPKHKGRLFRHKEPGSFSVPGKTHTTRALASFASGAARRARPHRETRAEKERHVQRESESKLKGFLKGARLGDVIATPVNRVGDFIWRKDSDFGQTDDSSHSRTNSDVERSQSRSRSGPRITRTSTGKSSSWSGKDEGPLFRSDLPVFRSPFGRDAKAYSDNEGRFDPVSSQRQQLRERRSSRFERLKPPDLDMRSVTPSPSPPPDKDSAKRAGRQQAEYMQQGGGSRRYAVVEGSPDPQGRMRTVSGDAAFSSFSGTSPSHLHRGSSAAAADFAMLNLKLVSHRERATLADVARVRALLLSATLKADAVVRLVTEPRAHAAPRRRALEALVPFPADEPVPRGRENVILGGLLVRQVDGAAAELHAAASRFSERGVPALHGETRALDAELVAPLTDKVRRAADDADVLASDLATNCTLDVKLLNERIDIVMRRRRRRLRWLRRGAFGTLEWLVVLLMWIVWLVVIVIRVFRGFARGTLFIVKWLLWLN